MTNTTVPSTHNLWYLTPHVNNSEDVKIENNNSQTTYQRKSHENSYFTPAQMTPPQSPLNVNCQTGFNKLYKNLEENMDNYAHPHIKIPSPLSLNGQIQTYNFYAPFHEIFLQNQHHYHQHHNHQQVYAQHYYQHVLNKLSKDFNTNKIKQRLYEHEHNLTNDKSLTQTNGKQCNNERDKLIIMRVKNQSVIIRALKFTCMFVLLLLLLVVVMVVVINITLQKVVHKY